MLTKAEILAGALTFDETDRTMIIAVVRHSARYKANPTAFLDLDTKLTEVQGTAKARQVNATMLKIQELGIGEEKLQGLYGDALNFSHAEERESLVSYMLDVLYLGTDYAGYDSNASSTVGNSNYLIGQRDICGEFI